MNVKKKFPRHWLLDVILNTNRGWGSVVITSIIYYLVPELYFIQDRKTSISALRVYNLNQRNILSVSDRTQCSGFYADLEVFKQSNHHKVKISSETESNDKTLSRVSSLYFKRITLYFQFFINEANCLLRNSYKNYKMLSSVMRRE